jgi:hypothetical protein
MVVMEEVRVVIQKDGVLYELMVGEGGRQWCVFNSICEDKDGNSGCLERRAQTPIQKICSASLRLIHAGSVRYWRELCP